MNITIKRIASVLLLITLAEMLMGCASAFATPPRALPTSVPAAPTGAPVVVIIESPNPAYALAQATLDAGHSQLQDLSRRATDTSLNISQAAKAAALATQVYNQRQKIDLDYQSTVVSLNMAQAAATQRFINQQTRTAGDAAAAAQARAAEATHSADMVIETQNAQALAILDAQSLQTAQAEATLTAYPLTATYAAYLLNVTGTVQAKAILDMQAARAAQIVAASTAYPLTATPFAETKAALLMQQYGREQQTFVNQIVAPLIPILAVVVLILFILVIVLAYRRSIKIVGPRRLQIGRGNVNPSPLVMIDGVITDPDLGLPQIVPTGLTPANPPRLPEENSVHVEIVNATEPPFAHWIEEVEHKISLEGGL